LNVFLIFSFKNLKVFLVQFENFSIQCVVRVSKENLNFQKPKFTKSFFTPEFCLKNFQNFKYKGHHVGLKNWSSSLWYFSSFFPLGFKSVSTNKTMINRLLKFLNFWGSFFFQNRDQKSIRKQETHIALYIKVVY
jgi:hypothetical protein